MDLIEKYLFQLFQLTWTLKKIYLVQEWLKERQKPRYGNHVEEETVYY